MTKKLRQKFVLVTMLLMVIVISVLFLTNHFYSQYWDDLNTLQTLDWLADSGTFYDIKENDDFYTSDNPVYAATLDRFGQIQQIQSSFGISNNPNLNEIVLSIYDHGMSRYRWKSFIYTSRETDNGGLSLVFTDQRDHTRSDNKLIGYLALIVLGFLLLLAVCFYLSRFVTDPAEKALLREKQFVSDASHELKTPLAAISINAQALSRQLDHNIHISHIISETKHMDSLIRRLLTLSTLEEKGPSIIKDSFLLSDVCEEVSLTNESIAFEKKIHFEYEIEENVYYYGNAEEIKQVIMILQDNALKHTPELGIIRFNLSGKDHTRISIYNTGLGISEEDLPHIFERFYCTEKSRSHDSNSFGLGLAIAKTIIDLHGGTIKVKSEYGKDACFMINL